MGVTHGTEQPRHRMSALNYSKWDHVDDGSDDGDDAAAASDPLLESKKTSAVHERDERVARRFLAYFKQFDNEVPAAQYELIARFIGVCDKGSALNNIHRYHDIIGFCARHTSELLTLQMVGALCALHVTMTNSIKDVKNAADAVVSDSRLLMEAINTLEACRRQENVTNFFEQACTPSRSDQARQLAEMYTKLEFGKHAMMRHLFKSDSELSAIAEDELDRKVRGEPPAGSSSRRAPPSRPSWWQSEDALILGVAGAFFAALLAVGIGVYSYWPKLLSE